MKKVYVRYFLLILAIPVIHSFLSCKLDHEVHKTAVNGILDLSDSDVINREVIKLNGGWEFYWNEFYGPDDFKNNPDIIKDAKYIKVPGSWYGYSLNGRKLKAGGYATYRMAVLIKPTDKFISIKMPEVAAAYVLYINGEKIAENGIIGKTKKEMKPQYVPLIRDFRVSGGKIEIIIQISNFHEKLGGLRYSVSIGEKSLMQDYNLRRIAFEMFLAGCLLIMSIYHLSLFLLRKNDRLILYFGIFCLIIVVRIFVSGDRFFNQLFPDFNWEIARKAFALTLILSTPFFCSFIYSLYPREYSKTMIKLLVLTGIVSTFIVLATRSDIYTYIIMPYQIITVLSGMYVIYVLIKAAMHRQEGALLFIIAFFIFFLAIINDILYMENILHLGIFVPLGLFIFIFFQAFVLSRRFSKAFTKIETMSAELQELNVNLEKKVKERTVLLENAKEEIEEISLQRTQFFINIAHEIKTPLTLIMNHLNSYIKKTGLNEDLNIIKNSFEKLLKDMLNFLDVEKFTKAEIIYDHSAVINLSDLVKSRMIIFEMNAKIKNINLQHSIEDDLCLKADADAIDRIINNLLDNAIKYSNTGGNINIALNADGDKIHFKVSDTGIGIPEENINNIFKPYYQSSQKRYNIQGIGMGLFIVKKILDTLKGRIEVQSKINQGSVFTVVLNRYIPVDGDKIADNFQASETIDINSLASKLNDRTFDAAKSTLLVVDDNTDMLNLLFEYFSDKYNVYTAENGKDALIQLKTIRKPDLIISDIMMDVMGGYEFIKIVLEDEKTGDIPVIFLTAKADIEEKITGLSYGAIDYIFKPFLIEELDAKINSILINKERQMEKNSGQLKEVISKAIDDFKNKDRTESGQDRSYADVLKECRISEREQNVFHLLIKGYMSKEISLTLGISKKTVDHHVASIYKKFNVQNKVELINKVNKR